MSNNYFQFKQFRVEQGDAAMKVSTDACIQGAWTPLYDNVKNVLDIGAGTGLLSLMLAQRNEHIIIDAIELDENAVKQATENVNHSPWKERINIIQGDVCVHTFNKQYDHIICNPPFFRNSLQAARDTRNKARHDVTLSFEQLADALQKLLSINGYASVLLPHNEHVIWQQVLKERGLYIYHWYLVRPSASANINRVISLCSRQEQPLQENHLTIYEADHSYTEEFTQLMKSFYLKL